MKIRMDKSGRIVFPKPLRKRLGLTSATDLEAVQEPGGVLLRPIRPRPSMIQVDGLWVHQGTAESGANWERMLEEVREERTQDVLRP